MNAALNTSSWCARGGVTAGRGVAHLCGPVRAMTRACCQAKRGDADPIEVRERVNQNGLVGPRLRTPTRIPHGSGSCRVPVRVVQARASFDNERSVRHASISDAAAWRCGWRANLRAMAAAAALAT